MPLAKDMLVIMVVAVNASWRVPVEYVLNNGVSGAEWANLVNEALQRLHTTGATIMPLTCDGPACRYDETSQSPASSRPSNIHLTTPSASVCVCCYMHAIC